MNGPTIITASVAPITTMQVVATDTPQESVVGPPAKKQKLEKDSSQEVLNDATTTVSSMGNNFENVVTSTADVSGAIQPSNVNTEAETIAFPAPNTSMTGNACKPTTTACNTNCPSIIQTTQLLLPDYAAVRQTVKDLLGLLQLYGPLTANQMEYNLPPVVPATIPWNVHDVLAILVAIGLVQQVKGTNQYCMLGGIPRANVILPSDLPSEIQQALNEADNSWKRSQILKGALRQNVDTNNNNGNNSNNNNIGTKNYKEVLKQIVAEYPQVSNDPVYWTALRNCHIDIHNGSSVTEKRSLLKSSQVSNHAGGGSTKKGAASSSSKQRGVSGSGSGKTLKAGTTTANKLPKSSATIVTTAPSPVSLALNSPSLVLPTTEQSMVQHTESQAFPTPDINIVVANAPLPPADTPVVPSLMVVPPTPVDDSTSRIADTTVTHTDPTASDIVGTPAVKATTSLTLDVPSASEQKA
jgi:hypothetical protein